MRSSNSTPYLDFPTGRKLTIFSPSLHQGDQPRPRHRQHLRVPAIDQFGERQHFLQPLARNRADGRIVGGIDDAGAQRLHGGIDLALLAAGGDPRRHLPDIGLRLDSGRGGRP